MKKKKGIPLKSVLAFIVTFLIYHLAVGRFFPVDENNVLQAPDWYPIVGILFSAFIAFVFSKANFLSLKKPKNREQKIQIPKFLHEVSTSEDDINLTKLNKSKPQFQTEIDFEEIIKDEQEWRRERSGLSVVDFELNKIDGMEGHDFERWCAELLKKNGFTDVEVTKGSGDQGVDVLAVKDGIKYAIQCKCYSSNLGNTPVQEVNAGKTMYGCQIGVVMTNRYFTSGAKDLAKATGVLLWDRDKLKSFLESSN